MAIRRLKKSRNGAVNTKSAQPGLDAKTAAEWLRSGESVLSNRTLARVREAVAEDLRIEKTAALRRAAAIDEEIRTIMGGVPAPVAAPFIHAQRVAPETELAKSSISGLVKHFAKQHPGSSAGAFVAFVKSVRPDAEEANVHSSLYKLGKDGVLIKKGERGSYGFWPRQDGGPI